MSAAENVKVVRRFFEELCNARRTDIAGEIMTADTRYIDPQIPNVVGLEAVNNVLAVYQNGVNGHWGVEEIHAVGDDRVVARWTGTGRHVAEVNGIPPTGKEIGVSALSLFRLEGGKIAEHYCNWDTLGFLQQIGVVPAPEAIAA